jgi:hypothetical protein
MEKTLNILITEVFLVIGGEPEERLRIGKYMGDPHVLEDPEGQQALPKDSLMAYRFWYAGQGDDLFVMKKGRSLQVMWRPVGEGMEKPARPNILKTKELGKDVIVIVPE